MKKRKYKSNNKQKKLKNFADFSSMVILESSPETQVFNKLHLNFDLSAKSNIEKSVNQNIINKNINIRKQKFRRKCLSKELDRVPEKDELEYSSPVKMH